MICLEGNCNKKVMARGRCDYHYRELRKQTQPRCKCAGCPEPVRSDSMCIKHYTRQRRWGDTSIVKHQPKGSRIKDEGYVLIHNPNHPNTRKNGQMFEHVVVMTEKIGRPLRDGETVHHKNGIRDDNRPENLELWSSFHPKGQRVSDLVQWAKRVLELYGTDEENPQ